MKKEGSIKITGNSGATIEGSPADINSILNASNCDISSFVPKPNNPLSNTKKILLFLIPVVPFIGVTIWMSLITDNSSVLFKVLAVFEFVFAGVTLCCVQGFFKEIKITSIAFPFIVILILLSFHVITPEQAATEILKKIK